MNVDDYFTTQKKFMTKHRDDMYFAIRDNDESKMFEKMGNIFLAAFAIGFHKGIFKDAHGSGAINHVNAVNIHEEDQELIIMLMLNRYPDLPDAESLWNKVEEFAEGGISILYESLRLSEWVLDIKSLI